jgi:hypothetical protein
MTRGTVRSMAQEPQKKLRWDRILLLLLILVGIGAGAYLLATR